ncbi:recombinase family protein [Actinomadura sp. 6N118]|uniref:recombinase family protein n=1 Tax=Actinomadura sp. 6N118 TaxID=3375151 RepID=UPI00378A2F37
MADRIYLRHSTDKQTDARQRHALAALLAAGAPVYEDPATSSRRLSLDRAGFTRLLHEAAVGDTIRIADAARLFRSVADILALRPVLARRGLHLRVESGLLSGIDLASDDPGTKMMVSVLAAVLEFQRDMISENTREGVAAAQTAGKTLGRPTALDTGQAADVVAAYRSGTAIKALARQHHVAPKTIRRILDSARARQLPDRLHTLPRQRDPHRLDDVAGRGRSPPRSPASRWACWCTGRRRRPRVEGYRQRAIRGRICSSSPVVPTHHRPSPGTGASPVKIAFPATGTASLRQPTRVRRSAYIV